MFLSKLNLHEEANSSFAAAMQIEGSLGKGWAAWAQYNDQLFKENPNDISSGANAVNCYMNAIGLYKNQRVRKYIARVLWLLSLDDNAGEIGVNY